MIGDFIDQIVLVTGGGGGIGRETALEFARRGATIVVADYDEVGGGGVIDEIADPAGASCFIKVDVRDEQSVARLFEEIATRFGQLDVAVNSAGVDCPPMPLEDVPIELFDNVMAINARGVFLCMRGELRMMKAAGRGAIVNIASQTAHVGWSHLSSYTASKHAVMGLTRVAAQEAIRAGVQVSAVSPGPVNTPLFRAHYEGRTDALAAMFETVPVGRPVEPIEVARSVAFLASKDGVQLIGQTLHLNGGTTFVRP